MTSVTVHQLTPQYPSKAFLNVDNAELYIGVILNVWSNPTYLFKTGCVFEIVQFDSEEMAQEYIKDNIPHWETWVRLTEDYNLLGG